MGNPTDFNDLAAVAGTDAVKAAVEQAMQLGQLADWPDPILLGAKPVPDIPADILPTWAGDMAGAVARSTQTPPAMAVMIVLSVLASVLQRRFEVAPHGDDYTEPLALWTLTAMPSGARKSGVISLLVEPLLSWEKLERDRLRSEIARVKSARAVAKKRIERLLQDAAKAKDATERERVRVEIQQEEDQMPEELIPPRLFTSNTTPERLQDLLVSHGERMAVISDESDMFQIMAGIYSGGMAALDVFLQGHAGSAIRVDRAGRSAHVDKPALSFGLALQPGVLAEVAGQRRFRDSGLLARFLFAMPASNVGRRDVRNHRPIPPAVRQAYDAALMQLLDGRKMRPDKPRVLGLSEPALELWLDFAQYIEDHQGDGGKFESIADWTSKLPGAVVRIAGLLELAEVGVHAEEVSSVAMGRAVRLGGLLIEHAQSAFGLLGADSIEADAGAVLKWIRANELPEFARRECHKAMEGRFRKVERLIKALKRLEEQYVVKPYELRERGCRPVQMYQVNPKALSTYSTLSP